ncbi:PAS domain S-box protein [Leptolyngbya sp. 'hensonii']|uniref:PAS domain S-box protein n=1 Tax=Leptolyngbya sp. 'hensonii' TaxID=1922337 RepID=UPI000B1B9E86|nr:PAS domain S-box protein [Leptolyngbya sp. 'hensonii']
MTSELMLSILPWVNTKPMIIELDTSLFEALMLMEESGNCCLLVVTHQQLVGLFTTKDLMRAVKLGLDLKAIDVAAMMQTRYLTLFEATAADTVFVLRLIQHPHIHYLPVVNVARQVVGLITKASVLQALNLEQLDVVASQVELALKESAARFRQLYEHAPVMMHSLNEEGCFCYVNLKWLEVMGYHREEVIGLRADQFMTSESAQSFHTMGDEFWRNCYANNLTFQYIKKDGSLMDAVQNCVVITTPEGDRLSISVVQDITEQRQAELSLRRLNLDLEARVNQRTAELSATISQLQQEIANRQSIEVAFRESEERLHMVLQNMPVMLNAFNAAGQIIAWNQECERITGYTATEIVDNPKAMELLYPDPTYRQHMLVEWARRGKYYRDWEWAITCKDGQVKTIAWSSICEKFPVPGWEIWGTGIDISDRKQAEAEILSALRQERELSELKSQFITLVSHEFSTPLSTILSSTELLQRYGQQWTEEKRQLRLQRIIDAVDQIARVLSDVLFVGQAEAGRLKFNPAPVNLIEFCHALLEDFQLQSGPQHVLKFASLGNCEFFCLDQKLLTYILINLVSNAIKYSPEGGEVSLTLTCDPEKLVIQVQDHGIGIAMEDQKQLFTAFVRGTNVGTIPGTGLGLTIVQQCVNLHHGHIAVASESGRGTLVTVTLPAGKVSGDHAENPCH